MDGERDEGTLPHEEGLEVVITTKKKKSLSAIALHRKLGPKALQQLKEKVHIYANDHTFKETAKRFGVHHSTVSGWVKSHVREKEKKTLAMVAAVASPLPQLLSRRGVGVVASGERRRAADERFIDWLRRCRLEERGAAQEEVCVEGVRSKVREVIQQEVGGAEEMERRCKWFLLWSKR